MIIRPSIINYCIGILGSTLLLLFVNFITNFIAFKVEKYYKNKNKCVHCYLKKKDSE